MNININALNVVLNDYIDSHVPVCDDNGNYILEPPPRIKFRETGDTLLIIEELPAKEAPGFLHIRHEIKEATLLKIFRTLLEIDYLKCMSIQEIKWMYLDFIACHETGLRMFS